MDLIRRPADTHDNEFLWQLHVDTMKEYVVATYGPWQEEQQRAFFAADLARGRIEVLERDGEDVGAVEVDDGGPGDTHLLRLEVRPELQGQGIGTALILQLQEKKKPLILSVMKKNPRAKYLYESLGFFEVPSEKETHHRLRWLPGK